ncbi:hypothetical protein GCM10023185_24190 [Hymenobacter saemangeumensis]|uniref:OmpA-like domain-containing protein n=1 Tax=Hymenobacter saemangeumensis TaxID=1084522 RepID=A0ABP8IGJ4_9BACT
MKTSLALTALGLLRLSTAAAQDLSGEWQGVERNPITRRSDFEYWPVQLSLQNGKGNALSGELYQEIGGQPEYKVLFRMEGSRTKSGVSLSHKGTEFDISPRNGVWCRGGIVFTYDAAEEKLTGKAAYQPLMSCSTGDLELYRVRLKSAATVPAGVATDLVVTGKNVRWFADADLRKPLAAGNTYRTRLSKTTTFYLMQGYYVTDRSAVVPITIKVAGPAPRKPEPVPPATAPDAELPGAASPAIATSEAAALPAPVTAAPLVLPTVLFKLGTAELLPTAAPALDSLAAQLRRRPELRVRVAGHTDRIGEPSKNRILSEQRAAAVKDYLVQAGIDAGRLETIGYGDSKPLYATPDARNRRVEVQEVK